MIISESEILSMIRQAIRESTGELSEIIGGVGFSLKGRVSKDKIAKSDLSKSRTAVGFNKNAVSKSKGDKSGINSGVRTPPKILNAWQWLRPWLPPGAKLTSGERTQADQDRIIRDIAKDENIPPGDLDSAVGKLKKLGYFIARKIGSGHGAGAAFDISGANLDDIAAAVISVSENDQIPVTFSQFAKVSNRSIVEHKNNAVHVGVVKTGEYDPSSYEA